MQILAIAIITVPFYNDVNCLKICAGQRIAEYFWVLIDKLHAVT
jgi:hypothetical protein